MSLTDTAGLDQIVDAHAHYTRTVSPHYDEILAEVTARTAVTGSLGKSDIGALLMWKRLRADTPQVSALHATPDTKVREHTAAMVTAATNPDLSTTEAAKDARSALSPVPCFKTGDAFASALILAAAPDRMAIYDRRAQTALDRLNIELTPAKGRYFRYMGIVEQLATALSARTGNAWTNRNVDEALYILGG